MTFSGTFPTLRTFSFKNPVQQRKGKWCLHLIFIIFYFYFLFLFSIFIFSFSFISFDLPFPMASHLGLNEHNYWMVEKWGIICKCSAPVGAPGCITQIEHHDNVSFLSHSQLIGFWEANLVNLVQQMMSWSSFYGPKLSILLSWFCFIIWLVQEYACSHFLWANYFYFVLVYM